MGNIYNSSKNAIQSLIKENKVNASFIPTILLLVTIPLSYAINNIALGLFVLFAILGFKKANMKFTTPMLLPILLYVLMAVSYFWSIDQPATISALSKEISLLLIPLAFVAFKDFTSVQKQKILQYYSYAMVCFAVYFLVRATVRYLIGGDSRVFFYHGEDYIDFGLVPKLLNAIHVSVFTGVAFFYFLTKSVKTKLDIFFSLLLFGFMVLLSSKNILLSVVFLILVYVIFFTKTSYKMRLRNLIIMITLIGIVFSFGKIKNRLQHEFQTNSDKSISANVLEGVPAGVHYVSIAEAWTNPKFTPNDYFTGTAFRVYQFRVFCELVQEENVLLTEFGLNASYPKIEEKAKFYNLFLGSNQNEGYQNKNFHNQYVQNFAELGVFGFLLLLMMLIVNVKNALQSKDFVHFAFSFLMISLFLTESFLWRQRGVVFFTLLYCLFNSGITTKDSPSE